MVHLAHIVNELATAPCLRGLPPANQAQALLRAAVSMCSGADVNGTSDEQGIERPFREEEMCETSMDFDHEGCG